MNRTPLLPLLALLALLASAASAQIGGGVYAWAPEIDVVLGEDSGTRLYRTNAIYQPGYAVDADRYRLEFSLPTAHPQRDNPEYPGSPFYDADLSYFSDSIGVRVHYQNARGFFSADDSLEPASNPSMRVTRLDLDFVVLPPALFGTSRPVNLRDGLLSTGFQAIPYFRVRYSRQFLSTREPWIDPGSEPMGYASIREMRLHSVTGAWGLAVQTNLAGFYLDPSALFEFGGTMGFVDEGFILDEDRVHRIEYGVKGAFALGLGTGYRNRRVKLGLEAFAESAEYGIDLPLGVETYLFRAFARISFL